MVAVVKDVAMAMGVAAFEDTVVVVSVLKCGKYNYIEG